MIILGLILVLSAIAAGILLYEGTSQLTDGVDIDVIGGGTISLPPLALLITGAAVISLFWLGWALLRQGVKRNARRRRAAKEEAALTEQRRVENESKMQEEFAQRERQLTEERRRHEEETTTLRRESDERVQEQHLSTEEARRRAEIAEGENQRRAGGGFGDVRDNRNVEETRGVDPQNDRGNDPRTDPRA